MFFIAFVSLFHYRFPIFSNICRYCEDMDLMWNVVIGTHRRGLLYLGVKIISSRLNSGILGMERLVLKHNIQAEGLDIAREKKKLRTNFEFFIANCTPRPPLSVQKNFSPIGPAVWPALGNIYIYTNVLFYHLDN